MIQLGIEDSKKEIFSDASLSHILAISGMHVSYVIIGISFILKKFGNRKSKYILIAFLICFAEFAGGAPSILRAVIMSILAIISKLIYRKSDTLNNISISCLLILILNPYNVLNLGFQLSFLGTLGIVMFNKNVEEMLNKKNVFKGKSKSKYKKLINYIKFRIKKIKKGANLVVLTKFERILKFIYKYKKLTSQQQNKSINIYMEKIDKFLSKINLGNSLKKILSVSISANILIFPILIYQFNNISFTFLISNILVTPILGIMSFFGYITSLLSIISIKVASFFAIVFNATLNIFIFIAKMSSEISITRFLVETPSILTIIVIYIIIVYLKIFYNKNHKKVITKIFKVILILVLLFKILPINNSFLKIYFIDVGQGDSTLIVTRTNKTILIDGGGSETGNYDVGEKVLVPYLLDRKIKTIDYMIFSHFDADHALGLIKTIEELNVKNIILSKQLNESDSYIQVLELAKQKKIKLIYVTAGNVLKIDDVEIKILHPQKELITENAMNNNSIVFKLEYKSFSMLFTGDIEKEAEELILNEKLNLNANILKVAHHRFENF